MAKKLFLGVYDEPAGYIDGHTSIGIYDGKDEEEARKKMVDIIYKQKKNDYSYKFDEKQIIENNISLMEINTYPVKIVTKPSNYNG